jgi:hypothetical protein
VKRAELALKWAVCWLAIALVGCANPNAKDMTVAHTAASLASGYRVLGKVDAQRQAAIRALAKSDAKAADRKLDEHVKRYDALSAALSIAADLLVEFDQKGASAALIGPIVKAGADVVAAVKAYEEAP